MALAISAVIFLVGAISNVVADDLDSPRLSLFWPTLIALAVSVGMFVRYLKFFRHYTKEVFANYASGIGNVAERKE